MPPVRDASTKPSAATVLPAPVACSNQKRLAALGSSTSSETSSSGSDQSTGSSSPSSSSRSSSGRSSSPGRPAGASSSGSSGRSSPLRPLPLRCASASSAVSVPDSASTWWADSTVPSTSAGSSWESRRSSPSSSDQRRRQRVEGTLWPSSSSASTESSARRRGVPGASAVAASSPSSRKGSRVNEARPLEIVGRWKGCDRQGRCLRLSHEGSTNRRREKSCGPPHDFEQARDRSGDGVVTRRLPGKHPIFKQTRRRPPPICHRISRCDGTPPSSPLSR